MGQGNEEKSSQSILSNVGGLIVNFNTFQKLLFFTISALVDLHKVNQNYFLLIKLGNQTQRDEKAHPKLHGLKVKDPGSWSVCLLAHKAEEQGQHSE